MRRDGIWHPRLLEVITAMGHTETLVVADAGLPVPVHVESIDLVWAPDQPGLIPVLRALLAELVVEEATVAEEASDLAFLGALEMELGDVPVKRTSHRAFKDACRTARAVVRTGECTPYSNVMLQAGVPFTYGTSDAAS